MFRKARRYGGVVVLGLVLTSSIALAQQSTNRAAFSLGFMADAIKYGDHSPWLVSATEDGKLVMRNSERPSSWQIYGKKAPTQNYNAKVEVISDIKAGDEAVTGAGVFFGAVTQGGRTDFHALLLAEDSVTLVRYENGNWNRMLTTSGSSINTSQMNTLAVSVKGDKFAVAVNGKQFASVHFENNQTTALGVIASGAGTSVFSNYVVYDDKGEKQQTESTPQLPTRPTTQPGPGLQRQAAMPPQPSGGQPQGQFSLPSQPGTQQTTRRPLTLATADPQHYQAMQIRFTMAGQLCRAGDQYACDDARHQNEWSQNAEELFQRCQTGDQPSCELYAQFRNETHDIVAKLQPLMTMSQAPTTMPASGTQQGRTAIPAAASQWAAIDPELTQALFERYAAATKLCQGGTEGACTWLRHTQRPEDLAARLIASLQRNCVPPLGRNANIANIQVHICEMAKANRETAIASARAVIERPAEVQWATDDELRRGERRQFQRQLEGLAHEQEEHNKHMQMLGDIGGRTPTDDDIRAGRYDYCLHGPVSCPPGVSAREGVARRPQLYLGN